MNQATNSQAPLSVEDIPRPTAPRPRVTREDLQIAACQVDFIRKFDAGVRNAGGSGTYHSLKYVTLETIAATLAHNGLRIDYAEAYRMERVQVTDVILEAVNTLR